MGLLQDQARRQTRPLHLDPNGRLRPMAPASKPAARLLPEPTRRHGTVSRRASALPGPTRESIHLAHAFRTRRGGRIRFVNLVSASSRPADREGSHLPIRPMF